MNRVDVVKLVVDLVDVDLDVGLVDVDLDVDLVDVDLDVDLVDVDLDVVPFCGCCPAGGLDLRKLCFSELFNLMNIAKLFYLLTFELWEYARSLSFEKCCRMH